MTHLDRRTLLQSASALTGAGMVASLGGFQARAADTTGYKALVCLFLYGGIDGHDVILPYDQPSYDSYREIRSSLFGEYAAQDNYSRERGSLLPLNPINAADFGGRQFALGGELAPLHTLFETGRAAIIGNVGPLAERFTRSTYVDGETALPRNLYSHNDQQSTWMSLQPEGAQFGWGGRIADSVLASGANLHPSFTAMSATGYTVMQSGEVARQYQMGGNGPATISELELYSNTLGSAKGSDAVNALLREHFVNTGMQRANLFERDIAEISQRTIETNELFSRSIEQGVELQTRFPGTGIGNQLKVIAETIASRGALGASRQVFMASRGGFDTHDNQAGTLPKRLGQCAEAIAAFNEAMVELGVSDEVTLFTMSDFGRTLTVNGDGTDHGWGGHHFMIGGAALQYGRQILGNIPPAEFEHEWDASHGVLIPSVSVEEYGATLGRWFGLTESELLQIFPLLPTFEGQGGGLQVT